MRQADIAPIFEYNYWANERILAAASRISEAQYAQPTAFPKRSLRGTLLHILDAEYGWRVLLESSRETPDLTETEFSTLASLEARWREEQAAMRQYVARLKDEDLTQIVRYTNPQGIHRERVRWHGLYHVVNHGTQHRSEAAAMLTDFGQSPGDVDFTVFLREAPQHAA